MFGTATVQQWASGPLSDWVPRPYAPHHGAISAFLVPVLAPRNLAPSSRLLALPSGKHTQGVRAREERGACPAVTLRALGQGPRLSRPWLRPAPRPLPPSSPGPGYLPPEDGGAPVSGSPASRVASPARHHLCGLSLRRPFELSWGLSAPGPSACAVSVRNLASPSGRTDLIHLSSVGPLAV